MESRNRTASSAARTFYRRALSQAEQVDLDEARRVEGIDDEIALLRLRLRRLMEEQPGDVDLLLKGVRVLLRAVATRYRLSPKARDDLAGSLGALLEHFKTALGVGDDAHGV